MKTKLIHLKNINKNQNLIYPENILNIINSFGFYYTDYQKALEISKSINDMKSVYIHCLRGSFNKISKNELKNLKIDKIFEFDLNNKNKGN